MAEIRLEGLQKVFRTRTATVTAVKDLTLRFASSTVTCLLGPSGCGKTTLMRMIAGLETPSSGEVYFGDERVTKLTPSERDIGMVFQYPVVDRGTDVYANIELPLKEVRGLSRQARRARVDEVLDMLELTPHAHKSVDRLDNGTLQKVAVARAVARRPKIILFDEPITNVDAESKLQLKTALKNLTKQHSQTIVYVTHDQTEAMTLADDIALMRAGDIVQRGSPEEVYDHPNDRFGGWFLGNPGMNFVPHRVTDGYVQAPLFPEPLFAGPLRAEVETGLVLVGVRPERLRVSAQTGAGAVAARVTHRAVVSGGQHLLTLQVGGQTLKAKVPPSSLAAEQKVWVYVPKEAVTLFSEDGQRLETALA
ncbi:ABC transporter ATP-binding protein [soil metagenome]